MGVFTRFVNIFVFMTLVCHLIKAENITIAKRRINMKVTCSTINVTFHKKLSCRADIDVISLDNNSFQLTNLTVLRRSKDFISSVVIFEETCFKDRRFYGVDYTIMENKQITSAVASSRIDGDYIYDMACSELEISLYDAVVENVTDGCVVKPLGLDLECSSHNLKLYLELEVNLQVWPDNNFTVASVISMHSKRKDNGTCQDDGSFEKQFNLNVTKKSCQTLAEFSPPTRCLSADWNIYAWKKCSKYAFGLKVLHLDGRFDHLVFNNLTSFCQAQYPEMKNCTNENPSCTSPYVESGRYYRRLEKSYDEICRNIDKFAEGYRCQEKIFSNNKLKDYYLEELKKCSDVVSDKACVNYSNAVLCAAHAQHLTLSDCTTMSTTYHFQKLLKDRDYANTDCSSADPCSVMENKYEDVCSGHPHIRISLLSIMAAMLFYFTSFMK